MGVHGPHPDLMLEKLAYAFGRLFQAFTSLALPTYIGWHAGFSFLVDAGGAYMVYWTTQEGRDDEKDVIFIGFSYPCAICKLLAGSAGDLKAPASPNLAQTTIVQVKV